MECGSEVSKPVTAAAVRCSWTAQAGSAKVSMLNCTSLEVNGLPLWNLTSSRSWTETDLASSATSQEVARAGAACNESWG